MRMRLIQFVDSDGENEGIVETDLTDGDIERALTMFESDQYDSMDVFDKIGDYSKVIGKSSKVERKFVEIFNLK